MTTAIDPRDIFGADIQDTVSADEYGAFTVFVTDLARGQFTDVVDAFTAFRDAFLGAVTIEDYAHDYASDVLGLTGVALDYFDASKFGRDLILGGDVIAVGGYLFNGTW